METRSALASRCAARVVDSDDAFIFSPPWSAGDAHGLDGRTLALVRIAALVAVGGSLASYVSRVNAALIEDAGGSGDHERDADRLLDRGARVRRSASRRHGKTFRDRGVADADVDPCSDGRRPDPFLRENRPPVLSRGLDHGERRPLRHQTGGQRRSFDPLQQQLTPPRRISATGMSLEHRHSLLSPLLSRATMQIFQ